MSRVFNVPAGLPFLGILAEGLLEDYSDRLADALVLLPSRRACLGLRDAFLDVTDSAAMLLPRMQPVADAEGDALPIGPAEPDIPLAVDPLRRQLLLARLVKAQRTDGETGITDEHAIRLAADLAAFLDEMQTEEVPLERLDTLVEGELAEHWQKILTFLQILAVAWPSVLEEEERVDPATRRRLMLERTLNRWQQRPPERPIIAAGITGTVPAVARLVAAVAKLPAGLVLLPGLDQQMDEDGWAAVEKAPAHPQFGLQRLLDVIGASRGEVADWRGICGPVERCRFLSDIMRPAETSEAWTSLPDPPEAALAGLERAEVRDFSSEAELLALRMREALEVPEQTVALVTSDRTLGRRVAAEMRRFDVVLDDSAGVPLDQTAPGSFLLLAARAVIDGLQPVPLMSLLKHPLAFGGRSRGAFRRLVRALERAVLRGPRTASGFVALRSEIERRATSKYWDAAVSGEALLDWLDGIAEAAGPLAAFRATDEQAYGNLIDAHLAFAEWLATGEDGERSELWAKEAGQEAAAFMAALQLATRDLPPVAVSAYPALLAVMMGNRAVYQQVDRHPRAVILGQLESRLHQADTVLIGGLNEGVWPRSPSPSPWLNRAMRQSLGLPAAEQAIGIAAHDFVQAASGKRVLLSRASKDSGGAPTTPSRWLTRLDAVLRSKGMVERLDVECHWLDWASHRASPVAVAPAEQPAPKPPVVARPRTLWATDVEALMRNPYGFYARRILEFRELDPLDAEPGAAERGQIIHGVLEEFVKAHPVTLPKKALDVLLSIGRRRFEALAGHPHVSAIWWPRFLAVAEWYLAQEAKRRVRAKRVLAELTGEIELSAISGKFSLKARADRVELTGEGLAVVDYKTGTIPNTRDVQSGMSPQLPLTALIAQAGGFQDLGSLPAEQVLYWGLKGGEIPGVETDPLAKQDLAIVIRQAGEGIVRLMDYFADDEKAYPAVPRPEAAGLNTSWDHLARNKEWQGSLAVRGDDP